MTAAVIDALEQRLAQELQKRSGTTSAEKILEFAARFVEGMRPGSHSSGHADLYGEDGLPR